jgi:tRNA A-37 threonylcarbamoyl transferase component Bud32
VATHPAFDSVLLLKFAEFPWHVGRKGALAKLHSLGIKHGDINKNSILVREKKAALVDLRTAQRRSERGEIEAVDEHLEHSRNDSSRRGGTYS